MAGSLSAIWLTVIDEFSAIPDIGLAAGMGSEATAVLSTVALFVLAMLRYVEAYLN